MTLTFHWIWNITLQILAKKILFICVTGSVMTFVENSGRIIKSIVLGQTKLQKNSKEVIKYIQLLNKVHIGRIEKLLIIFIHAGCDND